MYRSRDTLAYLKECNLDIVDADTRESLQNRAYYLKLADIFKCCFRAEEPLEYINKNNFDYLNDIDIKLLVKVAHQKEIVKIMPLIDAKSAEQLLKIEKPVWLDECETNKLYTLANDIIELDNTIKKNQKIIAILNSIILGIDVTANRPDLIPENEWNDIIKLSDSIYKEKRKISLITKKIESKRVLTYSLMDKVKSQLIIINTFMSDPTVVDRIESYENVFAKGNYDNLIKLSKLLIEDKVIS